MNDITTHWAEVDERGRLVLEPDVAAQYGLAPGARVRLDLDTNSVRLHRPVTHLAKLYIEPTNWCNIDCRTCMRNNWDVETGFMSAATFERILSGIKALPSPPTVMFSGIGEPLSHGRIATMIAAVKALGCRTEMITNGTLLSEKRSRELIDAGLDLLWVSIDGARPESYADVRLGAELPLVLQNLRRFRRLRRPSHRPVPCRARSGERIRSRTSLARGCARPDRAEGAEGRCLSWACLFSAQSIRAGGIGDPEDGGDPVWSPHSPGADRALGATHFRGSPG